MHSLWIETYDKKYEFPKLNSSLSCDICIIGAGIFGMSCAYYLTKLGFKVIVIEKSEIASKTTGHTTAKITSQHGLFYNYLINNFGTSFARLYLEANEEAIKNIKTIIDNEHISCDFSYQNSFVYTTNPDEVQSIHDEVSAVQSLNFPCKFVTNLGLPFTILGSCMFENQAQFHPLKYVYGLVDIIYNNCKIFTHSTITDIRKSNDNYICYTDDGNVKAKHVILACHYPFLKIPGFYFLKMYQSSSYLIAVDTKKTLFNGMYLTAKSPTLSFRAAHINGKDLLLVGGADHKTGTYCNFEASYGVLEKVAKTYYPNCDVLYRWNTRDCITLDKVPYIGLYSHYMPNLYIGTGFQKWGMTSSNVAANIIVDMICGKENKYAPIFSATRMQPIKNRDEVKNMIVQSTKSVVLDKINPSYLKFDDIALNSGGIVQINGNKVGIFKDSRGQIFAVKPVCTHLGCLLSWNDVDKTWDCPCHGSRFDFRGKNLYDPAIKNLETYQIE